jgi:hypothetical protein
MTRLEQRIARIVSPPTEELTARRNAKFGRLNITPSFDLVRHVAASEARGDVRREFARRIAL